MGLDMSVYKLNKKMDEGTFNKYIQASEVEVDKAKEFMNDYTNMNRDDFYKKHLTEHTVNSITKDRLSEKEYEEQKSDDDGSYKEYCEWFTRDRAEKVERIESQLNDAMNFYRDSIAVLEELGKEFVDSVGNSEEIAYWRKHSDLNGYMERMYTNRGGKESFNCVPLYLKREDIHQIIADIEKHLDPNCDYEIAESSGFFWGETDREKWENSLDDFKRILDNTDWDNETVYYSCWW